MDPMILLAGLCLTGWDNQRPIPDSPMALPIITECLLTIPLGSFHLVLSARVRRVRQLFSRLQRRRHHQRRRHLRRRRPHRPRHRGRDSHQGRDSRRHREVVPFVETGFVPHPKLLSPVRRIVPLRKKSPRRRKVRRAAMVSAIQVKTPTPVRPTVRPKSICRIYQERSSSLFKVELSSFNRRIPESLGCCPNVP